MFLETTSCDGLLAREQGPRKWISGQASTLRPLMEGGTRLVADLLYQFAAVLQRYCRGIST
jgi:hypothetical protein